LEQVNSVMSITIQLDLPDALVNEARNNGLLESQRLGELLNEELRRERARKDLGRTLKELHSLPGEPMTAGEIQAEIDAVRAERHKRESRC
jgi:aminoglycoside phosphotransferase (APT) family kinase protein